jgi:hypothetical protein
MECCSASCQRWRGWISPPWQEAAQLAGLPGGTAAQRLASLIEALPDEPSAHPDSATIAARLIALLPRPASSNIPSRKALLGAGVVTHPPCHHLHVCDLYGLRAGRPMDRSKPSTAGAGRQRIYAGRQHSLSTGATAERWPVTINWAGVTGAIMTEDKIQPNLK